jgi:hypothetical protein
LNNWDLMSEIAKSRNKTSGIQIKEIIDLLPSTFKEFLISNGIAAKKAQAITTKFRDAGRRSAPWMAFSKKVPGRPQDGKDGNRINRWLLPTDHKYYADERTATLVEIKYYLQALSMTGVPKIPSQAFCKEFEWLSGHKINNGGYKDPITLLEIEFKTLIEDPRSITSGHIYPLDRGGKHEPNNTFLVTRLSNMLQGNNTLPELLEFMDGILKRHNKIKN